MAEGVLSEAILKGRGCEITVIIMKSVYNSQSHHLYIFFEHEQML